MDTRLYVGNLSYGTTETDLRDLFSKAGTVVSINLIMDRETGRSKGFAFIDMSSQAEAEQAIKLLNGTNMDDRELKVSLARPREERPAGRFDNNRSSQGSRDRNRRSGGGGQRRY